MKKNSLILFLLLSISNLAFAKTNLFCKNLDTADTECVKIAKEMYESRIDNLANAFVKTQKEKKGKIVDKQKALYAMKRMQTTEEFMKSFKLCGEFSKTQENAKLCLDSAFMSSAQKSNEKISTSSKKQSISNTVKTETQFETKPLSQDMKEYITKTHNPVKNKKIVIYPNETPNCPYGQLFMQAFNKQKNRTDFQKSYSFRPLAVNLNANYSSIEEANRVLDFLNSCGIMCIVNLENNWIYSIGNAVGEEEAKILPNLFSALKSK